MTTIRDLGKTTHAGVGTEQMLQWIDQVVARGIRRPGYPADEWTEAFLAERFAEFGLQEIRREPVEVPGWFPHTCVLEAWRERLPDKVERFDGFQLPHSACANSLEAPLVALDSSHGPVAGAIAVGSFALDRIPQSLLATLATAVHDPDGEFDTLEQTVPFSPLGQEVLEPAINAGAAAYVGCLDGMPWETRDYYVPYDGIARPIPGIWLSPADSRRLHALMSDSGQVHGRLVATAIRAPVVSHNIVGVLPGASDQWVIVGTHHDGPWASAVEDASGIALLLAQAAYWARVPQHERPHNLLFVAMAAHMVAGAGSQQFIRDHPDLLPNIVLAVHLEHAAAETRPDGRGGLELTGAPEPRWWFTTRLPELEATVLDALQRHDLRRSLVLAPNAFAERPPTDGGFFYDEGVPLVNFITAPMYLFDSHDTPDKIHAPSLEPVTRAATDIIRWTGGRSATAASHGRSANGQRQ
jgi:hypothetical protein